MYKRILVPVDGSPTSSKALNAAIAMAKESGGQLRLLYLCEELGYAGFDVTGASYAELVNAIREAGGTILTDGVATALRSGVPADSDLHENLEGGLGEITAKAAMDWKADLIVVGTHGRRGFNRLFMGSGAEKVIRQAPVPVLVIGDVPHPPAQSADA